MRFLKKRAIHATIGLIYESERNLMKKRLLLALATSLILTACTTNSTTTTSSTPSSAPAASSDTTAASQYAKDLAYAINNPDATFPQLTTEIADNEAAVLIKTSQGDIKLKLFPEQAPLAVENFLTHAKEGYYNGVIFHRVINGFMIQGGILKEMVQAENPFGLAKMKVLIKDVAL